MLNNRLVQCLDKEGVLHQAGFRSCMDNVYSLNEIVQGRLREGKHTLYICVRIDTQSINLVGNGKLSLVEVDKGKHGGEWLMNSLCLYVWISMNG